MLRRNGVTVFAFMILAMLGGAIRISPFERAYAQPIEEWSKTFGGKEDDWSNSVQQTLDGGYIITGYTKSFGLGSSYYANENTDVYLVKTDPEGDLVWSKAFGGTDDDEGFSVKQASDGGYIIAGYTESFGKGLDVYLIKTHSDGSEQWSKTFGGSKTEYGFSVQQTSDGGYIIAGFTMSFGQVGEMYVYLVKTDPEGNMLWNRTFGGSGEDTCQSVQQTSDGGYIMAGDTMSFGAGGTDVYLVKTDSEGNILGNRTLGGSKDEFGYCVQQTTDGGYIVAGVTNSFGWGGYEVYLIKVADVRGTSTISCSVSPRSVNQGEPITVTGSIHPSVPNATVTLTYSKPDGSPITRTIKTYAEGAYSDSYNPTEIGSWKVQVSWEGDVEREGASSQQITFTVEEKEVPKEEKKGCIIATATYGSELSPEVQFLRGFRENTVLKTFAGSSFMTVFNAWYYSFSPSMASFIAQQPMIKTIMKCVLYPLIGILHISSITYSALAFSPEIGVVIAGIVASILIGIIYFSLPTEVLIAIVERLRRKPLRVMQFKPLAIPLLISLVFMFLGEITASSIIMMVVSTSFVLTTLISSAIIIATRVIDRVRKAILV